jgi:hypothetical protein
MDNAVMVFFNHADFYYKPIVSKRKLELWAKA